MCPTLLGCYEQLVSIRLNAEFLHTICSVPKHSTAQQKKNMFVKLLFSAYRTKHVFTSCWGRFMSCWNKSVCKSCANSDKLWINRLLCPLPKYSWPKKCLHICLAYQGCERSTKPFFQEKIWTIFYITNSKKHLYKKNIRIIRFCVTHWGKSDKGQ
jgi:hypothetical protein